MVGEHMNGDCPHFEQAVPQWCGDCGGFIGWHCYICGESFEDKMDSPGHCRCVGGAKQWVDGPSPTLGLLIGAGMRMDGADAENAEATIDYMAKIVWDAGYGCQ